ncbi:MAG: helix-turn-helix transcriptional regulator [Thalassolituus oleivorans]|uniref:helix-turn-helix domain-containing protein n=1 Tax=Thalassolituus oleivorans TaxID=187493 RepID=UPI001B510E93|nr:helix-turn-helix transcriptional regulator [Thalassolituus oleivorans]MBQ0727092.1 helix-turn-helix transcriptional regulator [Thalassolituus oleivorans]MBQ0781721.1 helix-turn-helix transcriptional regulator [Thalassolituus oleivorans]
MTSSVFTKKYEIFKELLVQYRKNTDVTQQALAERLGRPQSFVSKYENGERRLDLIEFLEVAEALQFDPFEFIKKLDKEASK